MAKTIRTRAREQVIAAAKHALYEASAPGLDIAPLDVLKIAAGFAADYIVQSCAFGDRASHLRLADAIRSEFLKQVRHYEDLYLGGGERC